MNESPSWRAVLRAALRPRLRAKLAFSTVVATAVVLATLMAEDGHFRSVRGRGRRHGPGGKGR